MNHTRRYLSFKRRKQGMMLNPYYDKAHKETTPRLVALEQSHYISDRDRSRDGSTDAFSGNIRRGGDFTLSGIMSPGTNNDIVS